MNAKRLISEISLKYFSDKNTYTIICLLLLFADELIVGFDWSAKVNRWIRGQGKSPFYRLVPGLCGGPGRGGTKKVKKTRKNPKKGVPDFILLFGDPQK